MSPWNWVMIIARIIELIAEGMSRAGAVAAAAAIYNVDERKIWKRGGF